MFSLMQKNVNIAKLRDVSLRLTKVKYFHLKGDALLFVHLLCCCCATHLCRIASHSLAPLQLTLLLKEHKNFSSWQPASGEMTEIRMNIFVPFLYVFSGTLAGFTQVIFFCIDSFQASEVV